VAEIVGLACSHAISPMICVFNDLDGGPLEAAGLVCSCLCWQCKPKTKENSHNKSKSCILCSAWLVWNSN